MIMALKLHLVLVQLFLYVCNHYATASVITFDILTNYSQPFDDLEAAFGTTIGNDGFLGLLVLVDPVTACEPLANAPIIKNNSIFINITTNTIALIRRGPSDDPCPFSTKVYNAQKAKFDAAIVYNDQSDQLTTMGSGLHADDINIPSVFVGITAGIYLQNCCLYNNNTETNSYIKITKDQSPFDLKVYLIPFCTVIATCFFCLLLFTLVRFGQNRRRRRRNRLSRQRLKQLPVKNFSKADEYDVCAICLDEYEEGDKLRILPCKHAYHCQCVDPWLTASKRVCPLCKRRVLSDDESSNSEDETDDESTTNEEAPLLQNAAAASPNASRYATGFSTVNPFVRSYSSTTEESVEQASLRSDAVLASRVEEERLNESGSTQLTPEFYSLHDHTPNQLVVLADVSASIPNASSSVVSTESIEAYSCKSASSSDSESVTGEDGSHVLILRSGTDCHVMDENETDA